MVLKSFEKDFCHHQAMGRKSLRANEVLQFDLLFENDLKPDFQELFEIKRKLGTNQGLKA